MVATIIVVGAIAGPVMAATGTTAVPAPATPASAVMGPEAGTNGISPAGVIISSSVTPPNFEWFVTTNNADTTPTLVYTVPSGYKLKIDDVTISYGGTGFTYAYMFRGGAGTTYFSGIILPTLGTFEHSYQNLVINGGESLRVRTFGTTSSINTLWTITAHWV